jgi:hypothetical protein
MTKIPVYTNNDDLTWNDNHPTLGEISGRSCNFDRHSDRGPKDCKKIEGTDLMAPEWKRTIAPLNSIVQTNTRRYADPIRGDTPINCPPQANNYFRPADSYDKCLFRSGKHLIFG